MAAPVINQGRQTAPGGKELIPEVRMEAWRIGGCERRGKDAGMRLPLVGGEDQSFGRQKTFLRRSGGLGITAPPVGRRSAAQVREAQKKLLTRAAFSWKPRP
jgi:hypothetical protein